MPELETILRDLRPYITGHPIDRDRYLSLVSYDGQLHAAWVPPKAQPGDIVCYFSGAPYPFITRRRDDLESHALLGDSYVEEFDEIHALGIDSKTWHDLVDQLSDADTESKEWMGSAQRTSLKEVAGGSIKVTSRDADIKSRRQDILQQMKSMHRTADQALGWITLR